MVVCAILITIAQNVNKNSSDNPGGNTNETLILSDNLGESDDVINGVGIFLIVSTLSFVVFFAIGPGNFCFVYSGDLKSHHSKSGTIWNLDFLKVEFQMVWALAMAIATFQTIQKPEH